MHFYVYLLFVALTWSGAEGTTPQHAILACEFFGVEGSQEAADSRKPFYLLLTCLKI